MQGNSDDLEKDTQLSVSLGWTPLHIATEKRDLNQVKNLISEGAYIDAQDKFKRTPLTIAASRGDLQLTSILLENGADVNTGFPLHYASEKGQTEIVRCLIKSGADVNLVKDQNYPLIIAASYGHLETVKVLVENGAEVDRTDDTNATALHLACYSENTDVISFLIDVGSDINATDKFDFTPLQMCISFKEDKPELVQLLLSKGASIEKFDAQNLTYLHDSGNAVSTLELIKHGANVNAVDIRNETPLYTACESEYTESGKVLLQHGADPNIVGSGGLTALHLAAKNGDLEMVKELVKCNANVNAANFRNVIPLHLAVKEGHFEVVRFLIDHGSLVNVPVIDVHDVNSYASDFIKGDGDTPLSLAQKHKHDEIREVLFKNWAAATETGVDKKIQDWPCNEMFSSIRSNSVEEIKKLPPNDDKFSCRDLMGWTLLHHSIFNGFHELSSELIQKGVSVNSLDNYERTPLSVAASKNDVCSIRLLVDNGADVNLGIPLHHAIVRKATEAVLELVKCNCDVNVKNKTFAENSALMEAASEDTTDIVKILIENRADINAVGNHEQTALHNACSMTENLEIVHLLVNNGADVNSVDNCKDTPLVTAACNFRHSSVQILIDKGADVHWKDSSGWTPLHRAVHSELITSELIAVGADVNYFNENVESPLFLAASNPRVAQLLLDHNADPSFDAFGGWTPLHESTFEGNLDSVKMFLDYGIDVNVGTAENILPIYLASICGYTEIVQELLNRWCWTYVNPVIMDVGIIRIYNREYFSYKKTYHVVTGNTPVLGAAAKGHLEVIKLLHSHGANLKVANIEGNTALHVAVLGGFTSVVQYLVEVGVDVDVKNNDFKTPLDLAKDSHNETLVGILTFNN